jgi:small subunit ribosomal protein S20
MANIKASKKDIRRIALRTERNRRVKSTLKTLIKKVNAFASNNEADKAREVAIQYVSELDKAAKRSIIHANKASRGKAAVARHIMPA